MTPPPVRVRLHAAAEERLRRLPPARQARWLRAARALEAHSGGRPIAVGDAGCEDGGLDLELARRHPDWRFVAVDLAADAVARGAAGRRAAGTRNLLFVVADVTRPFARGCDAVTLLESLAEIPDDAAAVRAAVAALRRGGLLVGQVPAHDWRPALRFGDPTWRREVRHGYRREEVERMLTTAGLVDVAVRPTTHLPLQAAQDVRDRLKDSGTKVRLALWPAMWLAARLEVAGLTWGRPRAWFFTGRRP